MKNSPAQTPAWRDRLLAAYRRRGWRGYLRLSRLLKPPGARREMEIVTPYGSRFFLFPQDAVDHHVLMEGFYESEVLDALRPALSAPDAVLWVVGANFGLHAVTAKFLHPTARVLAFEPSPAMCARLIENSSLNQVQIELHTYALAGANGVAAFHANASGNPGMSTLHPCSGFFYDHRFFVSTHTPAEVIERGLAPAPTVLLIDAEGAEEEIIRGFGEHLRAPSLRRIVFETDNDFLETRQPAELHALIEAAGFSLVKLVRRENTAHMLSNFLGTKE